MPSAMTKGAARRAIFDKSIYTIAHNDTLDEFIKSGKKFRHEEKKLWVTGKKWFDEAGWAKKRVAVIFADATECSKLMCWGLIEKLDISERRTVCIVDKLRRTPRGLKTQKLHLVSTGKRINEGFIRPYALVQTPEFVG